MKKILMGLLVCFGLIATTQQTKAQYASVSFQLFYDELSPYGMWVNSPDHGYVWVPNVGNSFQPYSSDGYWAYTDAGWTWVSNYPWGWAPFHYGRWYYDNGYGYVWIPGNQWGPAWVNWRHCDGYYGWTPLGPGYGYGYATSYTAYSAPAERWIFVKERDFGRTNINNYYVDRSTNITIINKSTVINNSILNKGRNENYIAGPPREQVQKVTGKPITTYQLQDNAKPGMKVNNSKVEAYRPKIENAGGGKPAPTKVATQEEKKNFIEKRDVQGSQSVRQMQKPSIRNTEKGNVVKPAFERQTKPAVNPNNRTAEVQQKRAQPNNSSKPGMNNTRPQRTPSQTEPNAKPMMQNQDRVPKPQQSMPQNDRREVQPINPPVQREVERQAPPQDFQQRPPMNQMETKPDMSPEPQRDMQPAPGNPPMQQAPQNQGPPPRMEPVNPVGGQKPSMSPGRPPR